MRTREDGRSSRGSRGTRWRSCAVSAALALAAGVAGEEAAAAPVTWTGNAGSDWGAGGSWDTLIPPGPADFAIIPAGTPDCIIASGSRSVFGVTNRGALAITGGSLSLTGPGGIAGGGRLLLAGGTLNSPQPWMLDGVMAWSNGTFNGHLKVGSSGRLDILSPANMSFRFSSLVNAGTSVWSGAGSFVGGAGAAFTNLPGAVFDVRNDVGFYYDSGGGGGIAFRNEGVVRKSAGTGPLTFGSSCPLDNNGSVEVQSGTLQLAGGGTGTGTFTAVQADTVVRFGSGGGLTLGDGTVLDGAGTFEITNCTVTASGAGSGIVLDTNSTLDLVSGSLVGAGTLTVRGRFNWFAGALDGRLSVAPEGRLAIAGDVGRSFRFGSIVNASTSVWSGAGDMWGGAGAAITNLPGALFEMQGDRGVYYDGGGGGGISFRNSGLFRKSSGTGTAVFASGCPFDNRGTVEVQSGALRFAGGGTSTGAFTAVAADTFVRFGSGGNPNLGDGAVLDGAGTFEITNTTVNVSGNAPGVTLQTNAALSHISGSLAGAGTLTVRGRLAWAAGAVENRLAVAPGGQLAIAGDANRSFRWGAILNTGTVTWTGGGSISSGAGAFIHNLAGGVFDIQNDRAIYYDGGGGYPAAVTNAGMLRKAAGAGATTLVGVFCNVGTTEVASGTLVLQGTALQTDGAILLTGGDLASSQPLTLQGGLLGGSGAITGNVNNTGAVVRPGASAGRLTVAGNYTQSGGGSLAIELGGTAPGTEYDQLVVTNTATLGGALNVTTNAGYVPAAGDAFVVMSYRSRSGTFSSTNVPAVAGLALRAAHGANDLYLLADPLRTAGGAETAWYRLRGVGPAATQAWTQAQWDALDDQDGDADGDANRREYVADTDPLNSNDWLRITSVAGSDAAVIRFPSSSNRFYSLVREDFMPASAWTNPPVQGPRRGTGGTDSMTETNPAPSRFYRIEARLP